VYRPATPGPHPTLLHIHGGGWTGGSRETVVLRALPYIQMGFAVVNVSYRLARVAPAPAAVEDCLCALKWVAQNAKEYGFDVSRLAVTGATPPPGTAAPPGARAARAVTLKRWPCWREAGGPAATARNCRAHSKPATAVNMVRVENHIGIGNRASRVGGGPDSF
jgi:hypothetical protein